MWLTAWLKVFWLGIFGKALAKIAAPFVVPFLDDDYRVHHPTWGVKDATDLSWWNIGVRNGAHNMFTRPMPEYKDSGNTSDKTLEKLKGFQWRYRRSLDGDYVSFRVTWGKPNDDGKNEFYIGWVMNEKATYMRLTFFQVRPLWILLIPASAIAFGVGFLL